MTAYSVSVTDSMPTSRCDLSPATLLCTLCLPAPLTTHRMRANTLWCKAVEFAGATSGFQT
jgi:hypothetical protein